ncbi:hypothetical protein BU14_0022s0038 [Porphyra umbilicalis]|uniref:Uncharacterized protein n=1 Tax=Porphyra umbilicalis TaxID=2786 RepID=A0A1X6PKD1_PORUM|nr:hypothetical protein BU14_0022s0038 [Porphyra umbilicalis]|eukprot:OSX81317.1 hypothetical protein BU14_0022s0038 [Porphyra umbilicalis]
MVLPAGGGSDGSVDGGGGAVEAAFAAAEGALDDPQQAEAAARAASSLVAAGGGRGDTVGDDGPAESVQTGPPLSAAVTRDASTSVPMGAGGGAVGGDGSADRWGSEPLPVTASDRLLAAAAAADVRPPTAVAPTARVVDTDGSSDDTTAGPAGAPPASPSAPPSSADTAATTPPSAAAAVGAVYVLNEGACTERLAWVRERARAAAGVELPLTILNAVAGRAVSLDAPPLPVARVAAGSWVTGGLVAATASHVAAWRRAVADGHAVVAVVEDDTFPTDGLVERLPALVRALDVGSAAAGKPWHIAYLTRRPLGDGAEEATWAGGGDGAPGAAAGATPPTSQRVTVASHSGGGTSAYLLSAAGARYLLGQVTTYTAPLDEALANVSGLVALAACANDAPADGCPGNVVRARRADVGGCDTAAVGVGERRRGEAFGGRAPPGGEGDVSPPVPTPPPAEGEGEVGVAAGVQPTAALRVESGEVGRATAPVRDLLADPAPSELVHWYTPAEPRRARGGP